MRLRTKTGDWILGSYTAALGSGLRSYPAGHGSEPDIYLAETVVCDPQTGMAVTQEPLSSPQQAPQSPTPPDVTSAGDS
jgi:hypothetical protein